MNAETAKIKNRLSSLSSSFDELETLLEPLFAQTLPETLVGLEPLQQAKLQTVLPYLTYDLIFIYLKSKGIDPKTHPVIPELDRIREYFEKINNAENPPKRTTEIDKAAASRFIKHAISQASTKWKKTAAETAQDEDNTNVPSSSSSSTPRVPVKITQKMLDRAEYEKELRSGNAEEDEEEGLQVFEGSGGEGQGEKEAEEEDDIKMDVDGPISRSTNAKGKSKAKEAEVSGGPGNSTSTISNPNKRRRPAIDPFAGYGDDSVLSNDSGSKKVKSSSNTPQPSTTQPEKSKASNKKTKKKAKKSNTSPSS